MDNPQVEQQFRDMEQTLHQERWDFYPPRASKLGLHEYDGFLPDLSPGPVRRRLEEVRRGLDQLQGIQRRDLSPQGRMDLGQLELALQREQFELAEMRSLERDPMSNLGYLSVTNYVQRNYAPLEERLRSATKILSQVPEFLEVAARNLAQELARPILEASIESYQGMARFYREDLPRAAEDVSDRSVLEPFHGARETAARAVEGFADGLKARLEGSSADFAIGPDLYLGMLKYGEMVDLPLFPLASGGTAGPGAQPGGAGGGCPAIGPVPLPKGARRAHCPGPSHRPVTDTPGRASPGGYQGVHRKAGHHKPAVSR